MPPDDFWLIGMAVQCKDLMICCSSPLILGVKYVFMRENRLLQSGNKQLKKDKQVSCMFKFFQKFFYVLQHKN